MKRSVWGFVFAGLVVTLIVGAGLGPFADENPDGLEWVAEEKGLAPTEEDHAFSEGPLADYGLRPIENERSSTAAAAVVGIGLTFALAWALFRLSVRRSRAGSRR